VLKLQSSNLAIKFIILISHKLPTRFLKFCLEPEIFDVKDDKKQNFLITHLFVCLDGCQLKVGHETLLLGLAFFFVAKKVCLLNYDPYCNGSWLVG